jgi:hypothetical protein
MYIYAGKDEQGNTVCDLFMVNLNTPPYTPHPILSGAQANNHSQMVPLKSQHFCEAVCGKLLVFGRYVNNSSNGSNPHSSSSNLSNSGCNTSNRIAAATNASSSNAVSTTAAVTSSTQNNSNPESMYGLWMLDLDTLEWQRQDCNANFEVGGWNYFTVITENIQSNGTGDDQSQVALNSLFFLGNTDPYRPQGYDHFR